MFRANDQWDETIRVAKLNGDIDSSKRVAYAWTMCLSVAKMAQSCWPVVDQEYSPAAKTTVAGRAAKAVVRSAVSARCGVANYFACEPSPDTSPPWGER